MRPRRFETWDAAIYFGNFLATRYRGSRPTIRKSTGTRGLAVWEVTLS